MRTIRSHSEAVFEITLEIARLDHRLAEIAATIALPPDFAEMNEDRIPKDTAANLWGTIHWVRSDLLSETIAYLREAAQLTDADLRDQFRTIDQACEGADGEGAPTS
ncbi:MAG: hypothetical protein GY842_01630 [bacterium]|nr:hypothetical protein [bacterium]